MTTQKELKEALKLAKINEQRADDAYRSFESQIAALRQKQEIARLEYADAHQVTLKAEKALRRAKPLSPQQKEVIDLLKAGRIIRYWDVFGDHNYELVESDAYRYTKLNRRVLDTLHDNGHILRVRRCDETGKTIPYSYNVILADSHE